MPCPRGHVLNYDLTCRFCGLDLSFEAADIFTRAEEEESEDEEEDFA